jgi:hypothetical protein
MSISTLTADGHTHLAKMFRKSIRDKNFWEIVRTIRKRIDDVELVREGFIAIGDLAFESPQSQKMLGEVGACGTIIYGMKLHAHHLGIAFTGLTAVTALLLNGNTDNVMKMTQSGGCHVVVDVLERHLECAYVALGGALAVHRLAEGFTENASSLGTYKAGVLIVHMMKLHMDKQDLVLAGLKAMNALCYNNKANVGQCLDRGAYELTIAVLGMHRSDMDIVLMGCVGIVLLAHKRVDRAQGPRGGARGSAGSLTSTGSGKSVGSNGSGGSGSGSGVAEVSPSSSTAPDTDVTPDVVLTQQDAVLAVTNAVKVHRYDRSIASAGSLAIRRIIHNYTRRDGGYGRAEGKDEEEEDEEDEGRCRKSHKVGQLDLDEGVDLSRMRLSRSDSIKSLGSETSGKSVGRLKVSSGPGAGTSYVKSERSERHHKADTDDDASMHSYQSAVSAEDEQIAMGLDNILGTLRES